MREKKINEKLPKMQHASGLTISMNPRSRTLTGHTSYINALAVLQNGYLASACGYPENTIKIWNTNNGSLIRTIQTVSNEFSLAVLPNGNLASGGYPCTLKIWNTDNGSLIRNLKGHTSNVR